MRIKEKEFSISEGKRPCVLLIGNGLCRAFGGMDWDSFLDDIKDRHRFPEPAKNYCMPMPLKAAMLSDGKLAEKMRQQKAMRFDLFSSSNPEQRKAISLLVNAGFDYILTTNYTYEIECALLNTDNLTEKKIAKLMSTVGIDHPQTQYFINTFNNAGDKPVWHIHGEARKPDSMIIGQYCYGNLLFRYKEYLDKKGKDYARLAKGDGILKVESWLDAFVFGDVYIVGFGFGFSETDLWWLLEKKLLTEKHGRTVFFDPISKKDVTSSSQIIEEGECKKHLFSIYGVEYKDLEFTVSENEDYKLFYNKVYDYLIDSGELNLI